MRSITVIYCYLFNQLTVFTIAFLQYFTVKITIIFYSVLFELLKEYIKINITSCTHAGYKSSLLEKKGIKLSLGWTSSKGTLLFPKAAYWYLSGTY